MRLLIDLQACRHPAHWADAVALVQAVHAASGPHDIVVAVHTDGSGAQTGLRAALCQVVPPALVHSYLAQDAGSPWQTGAAHWLRDAFVAERDVDLVFIPALRADGTAWLGGSPLLAGVPAVLGFADTDETVFLPAQRPLLQQAALLLSPSPACSASLSAAGPAVRSLPAAPAACAALLWECAPALVAEAGARSVPSAAPAARPRMAYFSPLPPAKSGIAFYSVELLAELAHHYEIELIVEQDATPERALAERYPIRTLSWFEQQRSTYDRVVYHIGNSLMHKHMFALLRRYPGVVVLHDFFLSNALQELEHSGYQHQALLSALYESHGYSAIEYNLEAGRNAAIWKYPCNRAVIEHATGVIVHSEYARALADQWYGLGTADLWRTLPMIRGHGQAVAEIGFDAARLRARAALGYSPDDYVVCSFGLLGTTKLNDRLLEAFLASTLASNRHCKLVFVGENPPSQSGDELARTIKRSAAAARITITGFVDADAYNQYLLAADCAVQLRRQSRGETSASVLDCLLHAIPTIVNAHGSSGALPDHVLLKLRDEFATEELSAALEQLFGDQELRATLSRNGAAFVAAEHAPARVGKVFYDAIEAFERSSGERRYRQLLAGLARLPAASAPTDAMLAETALAISANRCHRGPRQLFIDVSALVQTDLRTGIQRVVRSILLALIRTPPAGGRADVQPHRGEGAQAHRRWLAGGAHGRARRRPRDGAGALRGERHRRVGGRSAHGCAVGPPGAAGAAQPGCAPGGGP